MKTEDSDLSVEGRLRIENIKNIKDRETFLRILDAHLEGLRKKMIKTYDTKSQ